MPWQPQRIKPGDPIKAAWANDLQDQVARSSRISGGAGLDVRMGGSGPQVNLSLPEQSHLRITGGPNGAGGYSWAEVLHQDPNSWVDSGREGTLTEDACYPINSANAPVVGQIYQASRAPESRNWLIDVAGSPSGDVLVVTQSTIAPATWTSSGFTPGGGTCKVVVYNTTSELWELAVSTSDLRNPYPDSAPANRVGWAQIGPGGQLYLKTISCGAIVPESSTPTTTTPGGTGTGTGTGTGSDPTTSPTYPTKPLPTGPNGPVNSFTMSLSYSTSMSGGARLVPIGPPPPP